MRARDKGITDPRTYVRQDSSPVGVILGIAIGVLLGVAVALLFAPQAGSNTRRYIRDQAKSTADSLMGLVDEAGELLDRAGAAVPSFGDREARMRKRIEELRLELEQLSAQS